MVKSKKIFLFLSCIISLCFAKNSLAQKGAKVPPVISKTNIALYNFDVDVKDIDLSSFYKIDTKVMDDFYKIISEGLINVNGCAIKPKKFLAGKIKYDQYGYPASRGKKVVETNAADNYISIAVSISGTRRKPVVNESNLEHCVRTQDVAVRIDIVVFDKTGEKIFDDASYAISDQLIDFHYAKIMMGSVVGTKPEPSDTKILYSLMKQATEEITNQKFPK